MSDEAKPWDSEAEVPRLCAAARPCRFSDCAENRARATVRGPMFDEDEDEVLPRDIEEWR